MNISPINSYNYLSFQARKQKGGKYSKKPETGKKAVSPVLPVAVAGTILLGGGAYYLHNNQNDAQNLPNPTNPPYVQGSQLPDETTALETTEDKNMYFSNEPIITTRPESERTPEYHTVVRGDRLADIVKHYAQLDKDTPDEKLVPYYELLEADNPGAWKTRDVIFLDLKIRVDSILPENIIITYPNDIKETEPVVEEEYEVEETQETEPIQITSADDTVFLNGLAFSFDVGTMDKTILGDYNGLVFGKYVVLDKKVGGNLEKTEYDGINSDSNKLQTTTYDEDGKIIKKQVFENNVAVGTYEYAYKTNTTIETFKDLKVGSEFINTVVTEFENGDGFVVSQEFYVGKNSVAKFEFDEKDEVRIGEKSWTLDEGTLIYNVKAIGSERYYGTIDGQIVRFDVLKNGFCVEYIDKRGQITSREQYDKNGKLICVE